MTGQSCLHPGQEHLTLTSTSNLLKALHKHKAESISSYQLVPAYGVQPCQRESLDCFEKHRAGDIKLRLSSCWDQSTIHTPRYEYQPLLLCLAALEYRPGQVLSGPDLG